MEFSKKNFLAKYVHYEVLNTKYFLRFFLPFFSSKLALEICPFPLPFCSQNADFLMGRGFCDVMSVIYAMSHSSFYTRVPVFNRAVATSCVALGALTLTVML